MQTGFNAAISRANYWRKPVEQLDTAIRFPLLKKKQQKHGQDIFITLPFSILAISTFCPYMCFLVTLEKAVIVSNVLFAPKMPSSKHILEMIPNTLKTFPANRKMKSGGNFH